MQFCGGGANHSSEVLKMLPHQRLFGRRVNSSSSDWRRDRIPLDVLKVTGQELAFERFSKRIVEMIVSQTGKEIGDVMQITPLEILQVFGETSVSEPFSVRSVCGQAAASDCQKSILFPSRGQFFFLEIGVHVFSLFSCWFSTGLHAFVFLHLVMLTPDRTRSTHTYHTKEEMQSGRTVHNQIEE